MTNKTLYLFTNNFPLGQGESFLYNEVIVLSKKFGQVRIYPLYNHHLPAEYILPENVSVVKFNVFSPYNRLKIALAHPFLLADLCFSEINSKNGLQYILQLKKTFTELTTRIAGAKKFQEHLSANSEKIDIAYSYWFNQWVFLLSLLHRFQKSFSFYTRIHGADVYEEQHPEPGFFFMFRKFQVKELNAVLAISSNGLNHFIKSNPYSANKLKLSRLGTPDHGLNPLKEEETARIVSCSALQAYKRVGLIADILQHVKKKVEWVHFGDGELKEEILTHAANLPQHITFTWKGHQDNTQVMEYYKGNSIDIFINVSSTEGIPVSIMEAISFGIPVIATNVGGVSEIVGNETGYLIEKDFVVAEVAKIIDAHLSLSKEERDAKRKKARQYWEGHFNAEVNYNRLYEQLTRA